MSSCSAQREAEAVRAKNASTFHLQSHKCTPMNVIAGPPDSTSLSQSKSQTVSTTERITEQRSQHPPRRTRAVLSSPEAREIYALQWTDSSKHLHGIHPGKSVRISQMFGVSPKAVRDIWNRLVRYVFPCNIINSEIALSQSREKIKVCSELGFVDHWKPSINTIKKLAYFSVLHTKYSQGQLLSIACYISLMIAQHLDSMYFQEDLAQRYPSALEAARVAYWRGYNNRHVYILVISLLQCFLYCHIAATPSIAFDEYHRHQMRARPDNTLQIPGRHPKSMGAPRKAHLRRNGPHLGRHLTGGHLRGQTCRTCSARSIPRLGSGGPAQVLPLLPARHVHAVRQRVVVAGRRLGRAPSRLYPTTTVTLKAAEWGPWAGETRLTQAPLVLESVAEPVL